MMSNALGSMSWMQMVLVTSAMGPVSMALNTGEWEHSAPELTSTRSVNGSCPIWGNYQQSICEPDVQNWDCIQEMWCPCFLRQPCCFPDFINWPESDFQFNYSSNKDLQNAQITCPDAPSLLKAWSIQLLIYSSLFISLHVPMLLLQ